MNYLLLIHNQSSVEASTHDVIIIKDSIQQAQNLFISLLQKVDGRTAGFKHKLSEQKDSILINLISGKFFLPEQFFGQFWYTNCQMCTCTFEICWVNNLKITRGDLLTKSSLE